MAYMFIRVVCRVRGACVPVCLYRLLLVRWSQVGALEIEYFEDGEVDNVRFGIFCTFFR